MKYLSIGLLSLALSACGAVGAPEVDDTGSIQQAASCLTDLPPGCCNHWKDPNVRTRYINKANAYLHMMSNNCVPYGPINGTMSLNSTFMLYFSDPYEPYWCYGYSVQLAKKGYVLCEDLRQ
jgi:hypothetical protein